MNRHLELRGLAIEAISDLFNDESVSQKEETTKSLAELMSLINTMLIAISNTKALEDKNVD